MRAGVGGPIDADDRLAERTGQVQRSGVPGDDQADPAGESNEPLQGKLRRLGNIPAGAHYLGSDGPLLRTGIHQDQAALLVQIPCHRSVSVCGPALCAPARTRA